MTGFEIRREDGFGTLGLTRLKLVRDSGSEIASIYVHPSEGTIYQLEYPSTKTYYGPETTKALAKLLLTAAEVAFNSGL